MEKTIAAISTAPAPGGIGIVRLSGREAFSIGEKVFRGVSGRALSQMKGYTAQLGAAFDAAGERLDDVVALVFRAPKSYTGEDVVELSCHGGLYVTKRLLQAVLDAGASPAGPGEFTRRAFVNGKLDLAQAEAVMGLIGASGEQARRAAEAGSTGVLSRRIAAIRGELLEQASHLAAWADFPEEDVPEVEEQELLAAIRRGEEELSSLLAGFERGRAYREGLETVIAGRPNAGKSTLMNLLSGCERSIVTQYAGTTRDVVEETVLLARGAPAAGGHGGPAGHGRPGGEHWRAGGEKTLGDGPAGAGSVRLLPGAGERGLGIDGGAAKRALYRHHQQDGPAHRHRRGGGALSL